MPEEPPVDQQHSAASIAQSGGSDDGFTRLHITPLDAQLLKVVVPATVLPKARNISFHAIATFPENRYGFVDLPQADAEKLRAKLNGSVLKGVKIRIDKARQQEEMTPAGEDPEYRSKSGKTKDGSKKRKRDDNVVEGIALADRKVKRGWTETPDQKVKKKRKDKAEKSEKKKEKEKKKRVRSKYTDQEECLLKVKVPPNAVANLPDEDPLEKKKRKKKGKSSREVTVHEFEKTTKFPSFLKDSTSGSSKSAAADFVEGKGWVDVEGNVVEAVKTGKQMAKPPKPTTSKRAPPIEDEDDSDTSSSGTSSDGESSAEEPAKQAEATQDDDSDTSSDGSSSSEDSDDDSPTKPSELKSPVTAIKSDPSRPASSGSSRSLKITIPPPDTPATKTVHPLEALYKRKKPEASVQTPAKDAEPFKFFGGGGDEDEDSEQPSQTLAIPMTPFTRQDMESRNIRSAAPTPDTAHPTRIHNFWPSALDIDEEVEEEEEEEEEEEDAEMGDNEDGKGKAVIEADGEEDEEGKGPTATGDFQAWFWENRRDLNKSWMTRRKSAAKEKRHRENKARSSRAV